MDCRFIYGFHILHWHHMPLGWDGVKMKDLDIIAIFWFCCRLGHPCFTNTFLLLMYYVDEQCRGFSYHSPFNIETIRGCNQGSLVLPRCSHFVGDRKLNTSHVTLFPQHTSTFSCFIRKIAYVSKHQKRVLVSTVFDSKDSTIAKFCLFFYFVLMMWIIQNDTGGCQGWLESIFETGKHRYNDLHITDACVRQYCPQW